MAGFSTEAKVGIFVMIGLAVLAYMTLRLGEFQLGEPEGYTVWAVFDEASGLKKNAPVEMAGIQIGTVSGIELYEGQARVNMFLDSKAPVTADATAFIRTRGVLGDKYVSIEPGSPGAPKLTDGQRLAKAKVPTDLETVMNEVGDVAKNIGAIAESLKVSLASPESQQNIQEALANIRELSASLKVVIADNQRRLNQIVTNMERFTGDLSNFTASNRHALDAMVQNFADASEQLSGTVNSLNSVLGKIDQGKGTLGELVNNKQTVQDLNDTLAQLKEVSAKINRGEGTIGRLINDDTTVDRIDTALKGINDYIGRGDAWRVYVDYRGEYLAQNEGLRSTFNVRLQPKADKFYLLGVVTDPVGERSEFETYTTTTEDGVTSTSRVKQVKWDRDEFQWNAQLGKRFHNLTLRAGLFASTGGFGLDYHFWDDQATATFEAYDWRLDGNPHLKFALDWSFWKYFYATAGYDNPMSVDDTESWFVGAGVRFYDDDLKFLLTSAPAP